MDSLRDQRTLCNAIASQFIRHNFPRFTAMSSEQTFEESLCRCPITARLQKYINNVTVLVNGSPQIVLLPVYLHENFIYVECVSITCEVDPGSETVA